MDLFRNKNKSEENMEFNIITNNIKLSLKLQENELNGYVENTITKNVVMSFNMQNIDDVKKIVEFMPDISKYLSNITSNLK